MSQKKLSKATFKVDGIYSPGHARRCEAMVRNAAGGIESVMVDDMTGTVTVVFDAKHQTQHSVRDIIDETGYTIID